MFYKHAVYQKMKMKMKFVGEGIESWNSSRTHRQDFLLWPWPWPDDLDI